MTILHGDDRVYNNIIVQKYPVTAPSIAPDSPDHQIAGTAPFDIFTSYDEWVVNFMLDREPDMNGLAPYHFGHLPVWIGGNAYFNGAPSAGTRRQVLSGRQGTSQLHWQRRMGI